MSRSAMSTPAVGQTPRSAPPDVRRLFRRLRTPAGMPLRGLLPLAVGLLLWQLLGDEQSVTAPPPSTWFPALVELQEEGTLLSATGTTLVTFVLALVVATVVGGVVGALIGASHVVDRGLGPLIEFLRILPSPVTIPVALILFGVTLATNVGIVTFAAIWPIMLSTAAAMRSIPPTRLEMARAYRLTRSESIRKVVLPSLVPSLALGVRIAAPIAIIVTLTTEFLTGNGGLGAELLLSQRRFDSATVYGLVVVVGIIGLVINMLVSAIENRVMRGWGERVGARGGG